MLILLDMDGVMVPARSWQQPELLNDGFPKFSERAVHALNNILSITNGEILLTTSHKSSYSLSQWKDILAKRGILINNIQKLVDSLPGTSRKDEIMNWYNVTGEDNFIVLDDDKSLNELPRLLKSKLILTSASVGLTNELAEDAIRVAANQKLAYA